MYCNDKAKDLMDIRSKELQVKQQLNSCVAKCVDGHMQLIPTMIRKMKESLVNHQKTRLFVSDNGVEGRLYKRKNGRLIS